MKTEPSVRVDLGMTFPFSLWRLARLFTDASAGQLGFGVA